MTQRHGRQDDGFTLIELLTVMIIIGVLAGIAIPSFLGRRQNAYEAANRSVLHDAATAEMTYAMDHPAYTAAAADLVPEGMRSGDVTITATVDGDQAYCLVAHNAHGGADYKLDSSGQSEPVRLAVPAGAPATYGQCAALT